MLRLFPGQVIADELTDEVLDAAGMGGARKYGVDGDAGAGGVLGEAASNDVFVIP